MLEAVAEPMNTRLRFVPPEFATYSVSPDGAVRDIAMPQGSEPTKMPVGSNALAACCQTSRRPAERFDVEFESGDWKRRGDGRYSREIRALVRRKETGELSFSRDRSFELTIRAGKVSRYEMRFDG